MSEMYHSTIRLFLEDDLESGRMIQCTQAQKNYLANVMRLADGAEFHVFNGRQGEWRARIVQTGKSRRSYELEILEVLHPQTEPQDIHYLFAPLKRQRLDYIVQKATELGVSRIQPVITERTQVARVKSERMRANVIEAAEQCGILTIPEIGEPARLSTIMKSWAPNRHLIFCDENAVQSSPLAALSHITSGPIGVLIGPEGGFSESERNNLLQQSFVVPLSLGPRIMRADTAGVAVLSLVNATLGDWK